MSSAAGPGPAVGCVAITGATGMVGRHLCDHFRAAGLAVLDRLRSF